MKKIAVLISGRGSNLFSLIKNAKNYQIIAVYSNSESASGLRYATEVNIPTYVFAKNLEHSAKEQKQKLFEHLEKLNPDLICLAGFMSIVPKEFIAKFPNRIINIHPSLLPKFPGLNTHQRAIEAKEIEHGCTVHYVDEGIDTGEIIAQGKCLMAPDDTPETLAEKVLKLEHQLYPNVINNLCQ